MTNALTLENTTFELTMEELNQIIGGEDQLDGGIIGDKILEKCIDIACAILKDLISSCLPNTFEEFYADYCRHEKAWNAAIGAAITAALGPFGLGFFIKANKREFMQKVYKRLK